MPFYWSLWDSLDSKLLSKGQNGQQYIKEKAIEKFIKKINHIIVFILKSQNKTPISNLNLDFDFDWEWKKKLIKESKIDWP